MELEVTWGRAVRVWRAYLWRNIIVLAFTVIIGAVLGAVIGFILGMAGVERKMIQFITFPIGMILGLLMSIIPIKLILGKDFGEFRLLLIKK